jgi:hypothetical protein
LRSAHYLAKILGASGIVAISRIIGFLTIAIGIQYIISSVLAIVRGIYVESNSNLKIPNSKELVLEFGI